MHQSRKELIIFYIVVTGKSLIILGTKNNTCDSVKKIKRTIFYINFSKLTKLKLQT